MNGNTFSKNRPLIVYVTMWLVVFGALAVSYFQTQYIYPSFIKHLIKNTEYEAVRVGKHLKNSVLEDLESGHYELSDNVRKELTVIKDDLQLWKMKLFTSNGTTTYSTDEKDIGKINTNTYFHSSVAKGEVFTKSVVKDTKSLEGETISSDVVETYIPIISQGQFLGAFELYYDITQSKKLLQSLISKNTWIHYALTGLVILLVFWSMLIFNRAQKERRSNEALVEEEQKLLQKSNKWLKDILNELPCAVVLIDKQRIIRWSNQELLRILEGFEKKDIIGKYCGDFLCPAADSECPVLDFGKDISNSESCLLINDSKKIPIIKSVQEINIDGEDLILESFFDITSRKKLEEELFLARKLESVGQLAAGIAHEINTPAQFIGTNLQFINDSLKDLIQFINKMKTASHMGKREEDHDRTDSLENQLAEIDWEYLEEEMPEAVRQSQDGINQISKIVLAMKELSHPGSQEREIEDLNKLIDNALTVTSNEWKYVANIELDLTADLPPVKCFRGQISQVFINIIVNAAHAISEQQEDGMNKGKIKISSEVVQNWAVVKIEDTGKGIPESAQNHIFDPFFTTKEVGKGTGQGLAIAYDVIVTKHSGKLEFETEEGGGTTFIVKLPLV